MSCQKLLALAIIGALAFGFAPKPVHAQDASVVVADQVVAGNYVTVGEVNAAVAGWMVIHSGDEKKTVIGFSPVKAGKNENVRVLIDLGKATSQISAMLHVDAGEVGKYEFPGADAPARVNDKVVNVPFNIVGTDVNDQFVKDTKSVLINTVIAAEDGFIVIHNGDEKKTVIGQTPIKKGVNIGVTVALENADTATAQMSAMIHVDKGEVGKYEFPGPDVPAKIGDVIANEPFFTVESVGVRPQKLSAENTLTVPSVLSAKNGWMVIHSDAEGRPVIGFAPVKAGYNANVVVKIDDPTKLTDKVYAMLHIDAGEAGKYEFPGPDVPIKDAEGKVIAPEFAAK